MLIELKKDGVTARLFVKDQSVYITFTSKKMELVSAYSVVTSKKRSNDVNTLEFLCPAPIFDSGKCMFIRREIPDSDKAFLSLRTESFASTELHMMSYVTDRSLVDASRLPGREIIEELYLKDSQFPRKRITELCDAYERKIELYRRFQRGEDLNSIKFL